MSYRIQFEWAQAGFTSAKTGGKVHVFEVTWRAVDGQHLLAPDDELLIELIWGVAAKAQEWYDCEIYSIHVLSNHMSVLAGFRDPQSHSGFKQYLAANVAKELNIRRNRTGTVWGRRSISIPVDSDVALLDRLKYSLSNATKERLVARPIDWPGVHAARFLIDGKCRAPRAWSPPDATCATS